MHADVADAYFAADGRAQGAGNRSAIAAYVNRRHDKGRNHEDRNCGQYKSFLRLRNHQLAHDVEHTPPTSLIEEVNYDLSDERHALVERVALDNAMML